MVTDVSVAEEASPLTAPSGANSASALIGGGSAVAARLYRGARGAALDPRTVGVLRAFPRAAVFLTQANRRTVNRAEDDTVIPVRPSAGLAAQVFLDEFGIAMFRPPRLLPRDE